jgi:CheY-like chemotaxis protein
LPAAPEGGARFRLWLLLPACEVPLPAEPAAGGPPVAPLAAWGHRVLLVEDNAVNAIVAEAHLQGLGLHVTTVTDGHAAVAACARQRFDLVLMDCQLPGLDGFEATRLIRAEEARRGVVPTPIVALTANALAGDRERCLEAGMNDHLAKPFGQADLQALVSRHAAAPR